MSESEATQIVARLNAANVPIDLIRQHLVAMNHDRITIERVLARAFSRVEPNIPQSASMAVMGFCIFAVGLGITLVTVSASGAGRGGHVIIAWGAIVFGGGMFLINLVRFLGEQTKVAGMTDYAPSLRPHPQAQEERPAAGPRHPRMNTDESLRLFAELAYNKSYESTHTVQLREVPILAFALMAEWRKRHPNASKESAHNNVMARLTLRSTGLRCQKCDEYNQQAVNTLYTCKPDIVALNDAVFRGAGEPLAERLLRGRCPACRRDTLEASFNPR